MLTRSLSCGALPRIVFRTFSTTPNLMQRKWGNSPSKDEPRDPRKHSFDRDPIPRPTTDKLLQELNEKRWNMLKLSKQQKQGTKESK